VLRSLSPEVSSALSLLGLSGITERLITLLPFFPLVITAASFLLAFKQGYLVHYGSSRKLFLPGGFAKALRLADKLTPNDLFEADAEPATGKNPN